MSLDHRQLRAFLQIAELGSLGRAAKAINLTQPALSRLTRELERTCGLALFERHPLGMRLTEAGEALVPFARSILHDISRAEETIAELRGTGKGVVRVGAIAGVARQFLPRAVKSALDGGTELKVHVLEGSGGELAAALADGSIDIAIGHDGLEDDEVAKLRDTGYSEDCSVVCSTSHPLAGTAPCSLDKVLSARWVLPGPGTTPRKLLEHAVRGSGRRMPSPVVETSSPSAVAAFVRRSLLLGWLPHSLYADEEEAGQICALDVPELASHRRYYIYKRRRGVLSPAAATFLSGLDMTGKT
jgi:DNA-binding transcriptional LysR family regulator